MNNLTEAMTISLTWGNRFLQMITEDTLTKALWSKIYRDGKIFLGTLHPEQIYQILQLSPSAVMFKKRTSHD